MKFWIPLHYIGICLFWYPGVYLFFQFWGLPRILSQSQILYFIYSKSPGHIKWNKSQKKERLSSGFRGRWVLPTVTRGSFMEIVVYPDASVISPFPFLLLISKNSLHSPCVKILPTYNFSYLMASAQYLLSKFLFTLFHPNLYDFLKSCISVSQKKISD